MIKFSDITALLVDPMYMNSFNEKILVYSVHKPFFRSTKTIFHLKPILISQMMLETQ